MHARAEGIVVHDLRRPLPFPDNTFDVVYHSHTLEHFDAEQGLQLMRECHRVLTPRGIIRVVVPDLEQIARSYVAALEEASRSAAPTAIANHEWMLIEMTDQLARHRPGGEQDRYIAKSPLVNAAFVVGRWGPEGRGYIEHLQRQHESGEMGERPTPKLFRRLTQFRKYPSYLKEVALMVLLGAGYSTWALGRYRLSGDVHLYMYDRFNLRRLFAQCGFEGVVQRAGLKSYVENWRRFNLDNEPDGSLYRPVSLFMEGIKPGV